MRSSFVGHHISVTSELRAGVVKAEARRVERSESLDDCRAQLDADRVMADANGYGVRNQVESTMHSVRDLRQVRNEQRTRKRRADHSPLRWRFATPAQGREQPSGPASGWQSAPNRGVAHAPAPSVTAAKCVSCAAQNAALVALPLSLQVVGVDGLATAGFADAGSSVHRLRLTT
jgi:hypothetical protein